MRRLDPDWEYLKTCVNNADAGLTRALLESHDIECLIEGEQLGTLMGPIDSSFEMRLRVRPRDLARARELLAKAESQPVDEAELAELAERSAPPPEPAPPAKVVDPRTAEREKEERRTLRFLAGMLTLVLTGSWLLLRGTGNNLPILLVPSVLFAATWLRLRLAGDE